LQGRDKLGKYYLTHLIQKEGKRNVEIIHCKWINSLVFADRDFCDEFRHGSANTKALRESQLSIIRRTIKEGETNLGLMRNPNTNGILKIILKEL
jgi:hypothetical protein